MGASTKVSLFIYYAAKDSILDVDVALKMVIIDVQLQEMKFVKSPLVLYEANILKVLQGGGT